MPNEFLIGDNVPAVALACTDGTFVTLSELKGISVVYAYPRTSPPDAKPIEGWDLIPGARGCTPQSCGFRDHYTELTSAGVSHVFGLSTQTTDYQREVKERLHLPFGLLSDQALKFSNAVGLDVFEAGCMILIKRITFIIKDGMVTHKISSISDPEDNAARVLELVTR